LGQREPLKVGVETGSGKGEHVLHLAHGPLHVAARAFADTDRRQAALLSPNSIRLRNGVQHRPIPVGQLAPAA